jgi:hypothetical protein
MTTMLFVLTLCATLYFARQINRFAKNENDWNPVTDVMVASPFPQCIADSGQLMAFPQFDQEFQSFYSERKVETPFSKVAPERRFVYPYDCLSPPTSSMVCRCERFRNLLSQLPLLTVNEISTSTNRFLARTGCYFIYKERTVFYAVLLKVATNYFLFLPVTSLNRCRAYKNDRLTQGTDQMISGSVRRSAISLIMGDRT